ncbi:hypothetical protein IPJ72_03085 [Candidatus Peregrinibacteria bacterium]|nr:MAG: hypothetical protein IPJ72_03085 [Candidatus Peregrinibacteria bacterium]
MKIFYDLKSKKIALIAFVSMALLAVQIPALAQSNEPSSFSTSSDNQESGLEFKVVDFVSDVATHGNGNKTFRFYDAPRQLYQEGEELKVRPAGWNFYDQQSESQLTPLNTEGYRFQFPSSGNENIAVQAGTMEWESGESLAPQVANFSQSSVQNATVSNYKNTYPNIDVQFTDSKWWRSKSIIINAAPSNGATDDTLIFWDEYQLPADAKVMIGKEVLSGEKTISNQSIAIELSNGEQLNIGGAILFDSNNSDLSIQKELYSQAVEQIVRLNTQTHQLSIGLKVPGSYLLDSNRVYPVHIDPTFFQCLQNNTIDQFAPCTNFTNFYLRARNGGTQSDGSAWFTNDLFAGKWTDTAGDRYTRHPVLYFDAPFNNIANGGVISDANLHMYYRAVGSGTASSGSLVAKRITTFWEWWNQGWIEQVYSYSNFRGNLSNQNSSTNIVSNSYGSWKTFDVRNTVKAWESGTSNYGMLIEPVSNWSSGTNPPSGWADRFFRFDSARSPTNTGPYLEIDVDYPMADVTDGGINFTQSNFYPGGTVAGTVSVRNIGTSLSNSGTVYLFFNQGTRDYNNLSNRVDTMNYGQIAPGATAILNFSFQIPINANTGNYQLYWDVDGGNPNDGNNWWYYTNGIDVTNQIDLYLSSINVNGTVLSNGQLISVAAGSAITIDVDVKNATNSTGSSNGGTLNYYFSSGGPSYSSVNQFASDSYSNLSPGQTSRELTSMNVPTTPGTYYLSFFVDSNNTTTEGNEQNNQSYVQIEVLGYNDLIYNIVQLNNQPLSSGQTISANPGDTLDFSLQMVNTGNSQASSGEIHYFFRQGSVSYAPAYRYHVDSYGTLNPGSISNASAQMTAPSTPGTYFASFRIDAYNTTTEGSTGESNNDFYIQVDVGSVAQADVSVANAVIVSPYLQYPSNTIDVALETGNAGPDAVSAMNLLLDLVDSNGIRHPLGMNTLNLSQAAGTTTTRLLSGSIPSNIPLYQNFRLEARISSAGINDSNTNNNSTLSSNQIRVEPSGYGGGASGGNPAPTPPNSCTIRGLLDTDCDGYADLEEKSGGTPPGSNSQSLALFDQNYLNRLAHPNDYTQNNHGGDPVNLRTGAFEFTQTDFELKGRGIPIKFERTYNSTTQDFVNRLGNGWNYSYNIYAVMGGQSGNDVMINFGGTLGAIFTYDSNTQTYLAPAGVQDTLTRNASNNTYLYRTQDGIEYRFNYVISSAMAILEQIADPNGNITQFNYTVQRDIPLMQSIVDASGRTVQITYGDPNGTEWDKIVRIEETVNPVQSERQATEYSYDTNGNLIQVRRNRAYPGEPVEWHTRQFTYVNNNGLYQLETYTDARGTILRNGYDTNGKVVQQYEFNPRIDATGSDRLIYEFIYTGSDPQVAGSTHCTTLKTYRDSTNFYQNYECYNAEELAIYKSNGLNQTTVTQYNGYGLPSSVTDPNGNITTITYDSFRRKAVETLPASNNVQTTIGYQYENNFNRLDLKTETVIDVGTGNPVITRTWDYGIDPANGNLISVQDPRGNTESYTYFSNGNQQTHTDRRGSVTTYGYDANGNYLTSQSLQVTDAHGVARVTNQSYQYDGYGNQTQMTDARNYSTQYAYDTHGNLRLKTDALNHQTTYTYDEEDHRLSETDALNHTTRWVYDTDINASLLSETKEGDASSATDNIVVNYTYDYVGNVRSKSHPELGNAFATEHTYDAANRIIQTVDGFLTSTFNYDANGNLTRKNAPSYVNYYYDSQNRLIETRQFEANSGCVPYCGGGGAYISNRMILDGFGRMIEAIDGNGNHTLYTYDLNDNRLSKTDALGNSTTYRYDNNDNQIGLLLPRAQTRIPDRNVYGDSTTIEYDELNRVMKVTNALNLESLTVYDLNGNVAEKVDRQTDNSVNNDHITSYQYDELNRLIRETDAYAGSIQRTYDAMGNLTIERDKMGNEKLYSYDAFNRLESESNTGGDTKGYIYDKAGNITTLVRNGIATQYQVNSHGKVTSITEPSGIQSTYTYDEFDHLCSVSMKQEPGVTIMMD